MAGSVNKVILIGNLAARPELKYLPSGKPVAEMRIATNETWTKDGQKQEKTEWHRVVVWDKTAENCAQYLDKGRSVYVEGKIQTRSWDDKNTGEKKYMTEIVANHVVFLGGGKSEGERVEPSGGRKSSRKSSPPPDDKSDDFGSPPGGDDDIPF